MNYLIYAVSNPDYAAQMIGWLVHIEMLRLGRKWGTVLAFAWRDWKKKNFSYDNHCPGWDSNRHFLIMNQKRYQMRTQNNEKLLNGNPAKCERFTSWTNLYKYFCVVKTNKNGIIHGALFMRTVVIITWWYDDNKITFFCKNCVLNLSVGKV
jgi:hypothetical protein